MYQHQDHHLGNRRHYRLLKYRYLYQRKGYPFHLYLYNCKFMLKGNKREVLGRKLRLVRRACEIGQISQNTNRAAVI